MLYVLLWAWGTEVTNSFSGFEGAIGLVIQSDEQKGSGLPYTSKFLWGFYFVKLYKKAAVFTVLVFVLRPVSDTFSEFLF